MKAGALDVILKPFKVSEILPAVTRALHVRQLRADNVRLQASLNERTLALEASNQSLETAKQGLERMLAIVSHDLRAPLQGIRSCIDLLTERGEVAPSGLPLCAAIQTEASHLVDLATDLIDVSRISRGQMPWHWDGIDPGQVIAGVVAALQGVAAQARVNLIAGPAPVERVQGDGSACRRLLINLVTNAIRHAGAANIIVSAERMDTGLRFVVTDDGRGIDPSAKERLGRPFAISGGTESPLGGVGLGLAICLGIAAAHGGKLAIHSRRGEGTRITIDLLGDLDAPVQNSQDVHPLLDIG
jgi:signal transduction histidine kinase